METFVLEASKRGVSGKIARREGFIPAVLYGRGKETQPVKLKQGNLNMILKKYGERANIKVRLDGENKLAIIKAVDRNPLTGEILHTDLQLVKEAEVVNWEIPVVFTNKEELELKRLSLSISFSKVEVIGRVQDIPDYIEVDVGGKERNDLIKIGDLTLKNGVKFKAPTDTILVAIK